MEQEIVKIISNYGILGLLAYVFIKDFFAYLNRNKVADTLKDANIEKKEGTDKVAEKLDNQQCIDIAVLKEQVMTIITNHLPHIEKRLENIEIKIDRLLEK